MKKKFNPRLLSRFIVTLIPALLLTPATAVSQCAMPATSNCQAVPASELTRSTPINVDMTFDTFSKYSAGITMSGATLIRLKVLPNNASCQWKLRMYIDNNPGAGTPAGEWETLQTYGGGAAPAPALSTIEVRVYNGCNTPISSGVYQNFIPPTNLSVIDIIDGAVLTPAGSCATNVNGAGTYLTNYTEYSFTIDYRVIPGLTYSPGVYQVNIWFCIVEE
jgi:hypothetical protein